MFNKTSPSKTQNPMKLLLKIGAGLDIVWAVLIACYSAFGVHAVASFAGRSASQLSFGSALSSLLGFIAELVQGAIFIVDVSLKEALSKWCEV